MRPDDLVPLDPEVVADPVDGLDEGSAEADTGGAPADEPIGGPVPGGIVPYDPFRRYIAELRKYPPLSREDEVQLARTYRATGDRDALVRLVTANLILVVRVAFSFRRAARNLLDLIQEGNLGLLQAIERFDPELGVRLPTYAAWWVRAYMVKFLLDNVRLVRVGTTNARRKLLRNLVQEKSRLEAAGFDVGTKLLAEHFGVSELDVRDVEAALASRDVSVDAPLGDEDSRTAADVLPAAEPSAEQQVARRELQAQTEAAIARFRERLGERERAILDQRILAEAPETLQALGERFGTTREAVRQAEARLMKRLAAHLKAELGEHVRVDR